MIGGRLLRGCSYVSDSFERLFTFRPARTGTKQERKKEMCQRSCDSSLPGESWVEADDGQVVIQLRTTKVNKLSISGIGFFGGNLMTALKSDKQKELKNARGCQD